ncbi:MAG: hypothetical protein R3C56_05305 [Pirellulaceae bacterium]
MRDAGMGPMANSGMCGSWHGADGKLRCVVAGMGPMESEMCGTTSRVREGLERAESRMIMGLSIPCESPVPREIDMKYRRFSGNS